MSNQVNNEKNNTTFLLIAKLYMTQVFVSRLDDGN